MGAAQHRSQLLIATEQQNIGVRSDYIRCTFSPQPKCKQATQSNFDDRSHGRQGIANDQNPDAKNTARMPIQAAESTHPLAYGVKRMHADLQEHSALCTTTNDMENANIPTPKNPTWSICAETESTHWKHAGMGFTHHGRIGSRHHDMAAAVGDGLRGTQARSCLPGDSKNRRSKQTAGNVQAHGLNQEDSSMTTSAGGPQGTVSSQSSHNTGETK